jgi:predicted RNA-binding protein with RPS1 domain
MAWTEDIRSRFSDWGTEAALARWPKIRASLQVGRMVSGTVIARAPFGVWLDIGVGHPALLLVPEMRGAKERPITFEDYPQMESQVDAKIISLGDRGEIGLSQHSAAIQVEG